MTLADGRIRSSIGAHTGGRGFEAICRHNLLQGEAGLTREAPRLRALVVLVLAVLASPLAFAQEHEHAGGAGGATVLFDGPPSGRAVVGGYTHFGFALIGEDGEPVVHQNAEFAITQNGKPLFSTTDTHEYDGLFSFDFRFTEPGPYEVVATSGEMPIGNFSGEAIEPVNESVATIELTQTGTAFEIAIVDADGALLDHTDAIVEFRTITGDALHARTHLHIHDAPIAFSQGFIGGGEYVAHVVGYKAFATGRSTDVRAAYAAFPVSVERAPAGAGAPPLPTPAAPTPLDQRGATASADGLTLHAMYDPNNQIGVAQLARIAGVVTLDENRTTLQHVDFALDLAGPEGAVFSTQSGHEYDGVFEYLFRPAVPGAYRGMLSATYDETELAVPVEILVVPPVVPILGGMGPISIGLEGTDGIVAGKETALIFSAMGPTGPAAHSEVEVTIFHAEEPPLYQFKLHTHDSGLTAATVRFPHEGSWTIRIDPLPTVPEASFYTSALFEFDVAEGSQVVLPAGEGAAVAAQVPAGWALLAVGAAFAALLVRRQPR